MSALKSMNKSGLVVKASEAHGTIIGGAVHPDSLVFYSGRGFYKPLNTAYADHLRYSAQYVLSNDEHL